MGKPSCSECGESEYLTMFERKKKTLTSYVCSECVSKFTFDKESIFRELVDCDDNCGVYVEPESLEEYKAALEHWRDHMLLSGCSHGQ
jgi:tRNA(His) 5'-end guanylyltransferase